MVFLNTHGYSHTDPRLSVLPVYSQKEGCRFKRLHSGTPVSNVCGFRVSARCCHVKGRPNHNKSVSFDAQTSAMKTASKFIILVCEMLENF